MTKLLEKALSEVQKLPEFEQDRVAEWLLAEIEDERRWDEAFANSTDVLEKLALEALEELRTGRTKPLDPDKL
jgi:hypothetical protein